MLLLDDLKHIKKIDKSGMLFNIEDAPNQISSAINSVSSQLFGVDKDLEFFDGVVISGMGGSAIAGDIIFDLFASESDKKIYINRGYDIPGFLDKKNLFIAISYSGNTQETLASLKVAEERGMRIICVSSGGKLKELAEKKKYLFLSLPEDFVPRAAFYFIFVFLVRLFEFLGCIPMQKENLNSSIDILIKLKESIGHDVLEKDNIAKRQAKMIKGKLPLICTSSMYTAACGLRLKGQFNENGKKLAIYSVLPEMNHNEIGSIFAILPEKNKFVAILLRRGDELFPVKKRLDAVERLWKDKFGNSSILQIDSLGKSKIEKRLSLIFYIDILSVYSAVLEGVDPTPIEVISAFKKDMQNE